ncbi:GNAT family N-acetyltransferase [Paracoccus sp. (in: a-proteobacteria)]|uniref:GNAT family N-acetyltransferase n=1 Tax=Paracoccus sp. TaxID=267 RepID=UPI00321FE39F
MKDVILRELRGLDELRHAEALQRAVWGQDDPADNADLMLAIQHEGGLVAGAFRDGHMLGFLLAFPSATPGVQHSHRLGIVPQAQGMRLGLALKWFQRDWCLARAITHVRWTFDPLRAVNAGLNVAALGGVANRYLPDFYGPMAGINAGLASDRIVLDWHLRDAGVAARAAGQPPAPPPAGPGVAIPRDIAALMRDDPAAARAARMALRHDLQAAFARGQRIAGFDRARARYLLA